MTVSAVARYTDVQQIDCVEIEPAVIRAAPYLKSLNRGVLNDPRVRVIFDDARNFLVTSRDSYDLIISEPSNPWIAGIASLFTSEYYVAARQHLAPGGMFVQWLQAYSLPTKDVSMIAATFAGHFPNVTLWHGCDTDFLLLGRTDSADFEFEHLQASWQKPGVAEDFATMQIHRPEGILAYFVLDDAGVRRLAGNSQQLNTDDRTLLEYDAPRGLLRSELVGLDHDFVSKFRTTPLPEKVSPSVVGNALEAGLATDLELNDSTGAQAFLGALAQQPESADHDIAKGRIALNGGRAAQARDYLEAAFRLDPNSPEAAYWLAKAEQETGDSASARATLDALVVLHPRYLPALEEEMRLAAGEQDFVAALATQLKRIGLMPHPPAFEYCRLAVILIKTSNFSEAESALSKGLAEDSYSYACHFELGELYLRTGKLSPAKENFEWAVRHFPDSDVAAFRALAGIEVALGDKQAARETLNEGRRVFPQDTILSKQTEDLRGT
jgi:tetratricopeptide (TPR) repeat protein